MQAALTEADRQLIEDHFNGRILQSKTMAGGCIADILLLHLKTKSCELRLVYKSYPQNSSQLRAEIQGLEAIAQAGTIQTPKIMAQFQNFICLGFIPSGLKSNYTILGEQLASFHKSTCEKFFGLDKDNYLGNTLQKNVIAKASKPEAWAQYFWNYRIKYLIDILKEKKISIGKQSEQHQLREKIFSILKRHSPAPSLIHGDLWQGNVIFDQSGMPFLIDPAIYYADREAELAMCRLFGGFPDTFYQAYQKCWPLPDGWRQRQELYQLYHLLNHAFLFGSHYVSSSYQSLQKILRL